MKIDVDYIEDQQCVQLTFFTDQFSGDVDYKMGLTIVQTFSADFYLDPEIGIEDFQSIAEKAREENIEKFYFTVGEEGIEAEIPESSSNS